MHACVYEVYKSDRAVQRMYVLSIFFWRKPANKPDSGFLFPSDKNALHVLRSSMRGSLGASYARTRLLKPKGRTETVDEVTAAQDAAIRALEALSASAAKVAMDRLHTAAVAQVSAFPILS